MEIRTEKVLNVGFKKLDPRAETPAYATSGAACIDLHAFIEDDLYGEKPKVVSPGHAAVIDTKLAFEVPQGHVMLVFSRSGHGFKNGVRLGNCVGVIDSDYRGELKVALQNDGHAKFTVRHGDRIAQAMILPVPALKLNEVDELSDTKRGENGFGSTGQ